MDETAALLIPKRAQLWRSFHLRSASFGGLVDAICLASLGRLCSGRPKNGIASSPSFHIRATLQNTLTRLCYLFLGIILLNACAKHPITTPTGPATSSATASARAAQLQKITAFELHGVTALRTDKKSVSGTLFWQHRAHENDTLRIVGPMGAGSLSLEQSNGQVTLISDKKHVYHGNNANALLFEITGMRIPVDDMVYWIRGLPAPGDIDNKIADEVGELTHLHQHGWDVDFLSYQSIDNIAVSLPRKIQLSQPPYAIKLVVKRFQAGRSQP